MFLKSIYIYIYIYIYMFNFKLHHSSCKATRYFEIMRTFTFRCTWNEWRMHISQTTLKEKMESILTKKVESLAELKFDPGFRVIGKYLSQIDWILRVKLSESIWLILYIWEYLSQIDSILRVILSKSIWLKYSPVTRNPGSNFSYTSDSIF